MIEVKLQIQEVRTTILMIKKKKWKNFKREIVAATYGAMIYTIWIARNSKIFKNHAIIIEFLVQSVISIVKERVTML